MYIWRGKNSRDKRNLLLLGEAGWTAASDDKSHVLEDEQLRCTKEKEHVRYFTKHIASLMEGYLETKDGKKEIELLRHGIELARRTGSMSNESESMQRSVFEIFSEFSVEKGSNDIDRKGLMALLSNLGMSMTESQFKKYLRRLHFSASLETIPFEHFYADFLTELAGKKSLWSSLLSFGQKDSQLTDLEKIHQEEAHEMRGANVSWFLRLRLRNTEARLILLDHAVAQAEQMALAEYRKAHPPMFLCTECSEALTDNRAYQLHCRDKALHREWLRKKVHEDERFAHVEAIFAGDQGRRLRAHRLIFHPDLGGQYIRVEVARKDAFRPQLMDGGRSLERLLKGSLVQGFDPSRGIRPAYRKDGLIRQHLAPLRRAADTSSFAQVVLPELRAVLRDLSRCQDDFIDIISCRDHPQYSELSAQNGENLLAYVRFEWGSHAMKTVQLIGEFSGWKPLDMQCDVRTAKFFVVRELPPGRYKYRFVVDGKVRVDDIASQIDDPSSPIGRSNVLLVTPEPIFHSMETPQQPPPQHLRGTSQKGRQGGEEEESVSPPSSPAVLSNQIAQISFVTAETSFSETPEGAITHISRMDKSALITRLEHINLRNLALYDDGVWALATYIQKNTVIKSIDLSYNDISDEGIQALSVCIDRLPSLQALRLNGNGFGVDGCRYITEHARNSQYLTVLELSNNRLGDDGFERLCKFMRYNEVLLELFVDACYVGNDGMDFLREALLVNRRLQRLSLGGNRIGEAGAVHIADLLRENACLLNLNLSNNPLGADGVKAIGQALYSNDSLEQLNLTHVDLLSHRSAAGLHALCYALKRNRTLLSLSLAHNGITDWHLAELGYVLVENRGLETVDLTNNLIDQRWMQQGKTLDTHMMKDMPSIATSLAKNVVMKSRENFDDDNKSRFEDDERYGKWTRRRTWKRIALDVEEKKRRKDAMTAEYARIQAEEQHLRSQVREIMNSYKLYLEEQPCKQYLQQCAQGIVQYFHQLPCFDCEVHDLPRLMEATDLPPRFSSVKLRAESIKIAQSRKHSSRGLEKSGDRGAAESSSAAGVGPLARLALLPLFRHLSLSRWTQAANAFDVNVFVHAHLAVLAAVFTTLEGGVPTFLLQPERLQQAMMVLTLPLPPDEVQNAVDETLVRGARRGIGLHRFSDYVLRNARQLANSQAISRARLLADLVLRPPTVEAKAIILHCLRRTVWMEQRAKYRAEPVHTPLFVCDYCLKRFATLRQLERHVRKGINNESHRRYAMEEVVYRSQMFFLQQAKHACTGVFFPAYFELVPAHKLPNEYYPQVVDKMGQGGRPIGVIEAFRTVKALDVLGDYLHVALRDQLGWVRYKQGRQVYLQPIAGFDWENLHIQDQVTYYRTNDNLPPTIELKVRHRPHLDAEVMGYLKRGQVIACMGRIENWLQICFEREDAAWILLRPESGGEGGGGAGAGRRSGMGGKSGERADKDAASQPLASSQGTNSPQRTASPVRKRRIDMHSAMREEAEEDEDLIFQDQIVTYEIDGKRYRNNSRHHPEITKYKISIFDRLRYGDPQCNTHSDLLLPLPEFLCTDHKSVVYEQLKAGLSPWTLSQQQLFDAVISVPEGVWRQVEARESGLFFSAEHPEVTQEFGYEVERINRHLSHTSMRRSKKHKKGSGMRASMGSLAEILDEMHDQGWSPDDDDDLSEEERVEKLMYARQGDDGSSLEEESVL